jgi:hypothetical protein
MIFAHFPGMLIGRIAKAIAAVIAKQVHQIFIEMPLVLFDRQNVFASTLSDGFGDLGLGIEGIDRHNTPRQIQQLEQFGDGRDFIGFLVDFPLSQDLLVLGSPGTHQTNRLSARHVIMRSAQLLPSKAITSPWVRAWIVWTHSIKMA